LGVSLKFFKAIPCNAISEPAKAKGYLFQIARNLCADYLRMIGRHREVPTDFGNEENQHRLVQDNRFHVTTEDLAIVEVAEFRVVRLKENEREKLLFE